MIPALTLEPLSWDDLPEAAVLWADPAVIRWTNIAAPCTEAGAADRLEHLLDCQRGLPFPTVFALREGTAFRGLAGCPPVDTAAGIYGLFYQLLPACWGRGLGLAAGLCPHRRPPQGFLPGGADAGYLGLRPPLGWSGGDRLTGTAPCNMKK